MIIIGKDWGMGIRRYRKTYIREWRRYRNLTLIQVAARLVELLPGDKTGKTASNISKIERGEQPYDQPILEALANALSCLPENLLQGPPGSVPAVAGDLESLEPEQRNTVITLIRALKTQKAA